MKEKLKIVGAIFAMLFIVIGAIIPIERGVRMASGEISSGWAKTYGGTSQDVAYSVVQTSDGGYAIAGYTFSYGAGYEDFWLVKTDSSGNQQWDKTYGGATAEHAYSVVQTSDGGYAIAGATNIWVAGAPGIPEAWLVKTDSAGNEEWNKTYGETRVYSVVHVQTSDRGYALAGTAAKDFWLVKTDPAGTVEWNRTYGGTSQDVARSVVQTSDGGYAIAGSTYSDGAWGEDDSWLAKTDSAGNMEWNRTYGGAYDSTFGDVVQTRDGGYALTGATQFYGSGYDADFWLVKTDPAGTVEWNRTYGERYYWEGAVSVVETSDGGYAMAGETTQYDVGNFWLVKTDSTGNQEWNETFGGTDEDFPYSVVQTSDGGYAIAGCTDSFGAGNGDFWLVKTDEFGVIPEYQPLLLLPVFAALCLAIVIVVRKRIPRRTGT